MAEAFVRRAGAVAAGVAMLGLALWLGGRAVDGADQGGPFRLVKVVDEADGVVDRVYDPESSDVPGAWTARVEPPELYARVQVWVDGELHTQGDDRGDPHVDLDALDPGLHLIETTLTRRGGRTERIADHVLVGPFAQRWKNEPGCGLSVAMSERTIERLLLPELERELLPPLRASDYMGPDTEIETLALELEHNHVRFEAAIAGVNRVEVEGLLVVQRGGDRVVDVRLAHLARTEFTGRTRNRAVAAGAAAGAVVTGPLAPIGAAAGGYVVGIVVDRQAEKFIKKELKKGLEEAKRVQLFPGRVELLPGVEASAVELSFCGEPILRKGMIGAKIEVRPVAPTTDPGARPGVDAPRSGAPGPVFVGVHLPDPSLEAGEDVALSLTVDTINALLDAWTAQGVLSQLLAEAGLVEGANRELAAWTTVQLSDVAIELPPVLTPPDADAAAAGWPIAMAGVRLSLAPTADAGAPDDAKRGTIELAGRGRVTPMWDEAAGRMLLTGALDDMVLGCRDVTDEGTVLRPCFGALLELGDVVARLNERLAPTTRGLPAFDLRGLIESRSGGRLQVRDLRLEAHARAQGALRLRARL